MGKAMLRPWDCACSIVPWRSCSHLLAAIERCQSTWRRIAACLRDTLPDNVGFVGIWRYSSVGNGYPGGEKKVEEVV